MRVPLTSTGLRNQDVNAAINVLKSGKLTIGKMVSQFEKEMAEYLGVKHFVMVNSGSSANLAIVEALVRPTLGKPKLNNGDGVIVPAIAWPTTIWPILQLGLTPIFVDIDPQNLVMDFNKAQKLVENKKNKIRAIFPIHPLGLSIDNSILEVFSKKNDLLIINDVCESLGSWNKNQHAGSVGIASTYSFYFSHHMTTMEGGGVATNLDSIANDLRSIRSHGWSRDRFDRHKIEKNIDKSRQKYLFVTTGFNIRPMEIQAAIGISQLKNLDKFVARRQIIAEQVSKALRNTKLSVIGDSYCHNPTLKQRHSWMLLPIKIRSSNSKARARITEFLGNRGVENRPVLTGNFLRQPALRHMRNKPKFNEFKNATEIEKTSFLVSCHHDLSKSQVQYLIDSLLKCEKLI